MSSEKMSKPFEGNFKELNSISLSVQDQEEMRKWLHKKVRKPLLFSNIYRSILPVTATLAVFTIAILMFTSETTLEEALFSKGNEVTSKTGSSDLSDEELAFIEKQEQETIDKMEDLFNLTLDNYHPAYNLTGTTVFRELQDILGAKNHLPSMFVRGPIQDARKSPAYIFWEDERGAFLYTIEYADSTWNVRTISHINEAGKKDVSDVAVDHNKIDKLFEEYVANTWSNDVYFATSIYGDQSMEMNIDEHQTINLNVLDKNIKINSFGKEFKLDLDYKPFINRLIGTEDSSLSFLEVLGNKDISTFVMDHKQGKISELDNYASTPVYDVFHKYYYVVAGEPGQEYVTTYEDGQVQPPISSKHHNIVAIIPSGNGKYLDYLVETAKPDSFKLMRYTLETNKEKELLSLNSQEVKYMVHHYFNQTLSEINNRLVHPLY